LTGNTRPTIEHDPPVVSHCNDIGQRHDQPTRIKFKNFEGNETSASVLDAERNKSGEQYKPEVVQTSKAPTGNRREGTHAESSAFPGDAHSSESLPVRSPDRLLHAHASGAQAPISHRIDLDSTVDS
jgi:hypothetical protein